MKHTQMAPDQVFDLEAENRFIEQEIAEDEKIPKEETPRYDEVLNAQELPEGVY